MKRTLLATAVSLALGTGTAMAGGIQIDPTGSGSIAGSKFLSDSSLGSSFGNFLATSIFGTLQQQTDGLTPTGRMLGHNSLGLGSFGITGELTFEFDVAVLPSVTGTPNSVGEQLSFALDPSGTSTFRLYFDSTPDANMDLGTGYDDGVLIARTTAVTLQGTPAVTNTSGGVTTDNSGWLDDDNEIKTIKSSGSVFLDLDFTNVWDGIGPPPAGDYVDGRYIVNDLVSALIDVTTDDSLITPYPDNTFASDKVVGVTPSFGTDLVGGKPMNNFQCSSTAGSGVCDFQAKMNTTFLVNASPVPEPGSLVLLGLGFGLLGLGSMRSLRRG